VLSDQIKNLDWRIRNIEYIEKVSNEIVDEVIDKIKVIIE
jgi:mRNA interferase MazF